MEVHEQRQGAVTVVRPDAPIVQEDAALLRDRVREVLARSLGRFVVDASDIAYVDSDGLQTLVDIARELNESGQSLKMCAATDTLREVFDLTGLTPMFEHYEDVQTAVRSFL